MALFSHPVWQSQLWWLSLCLFLAGLAGSWLFLLRHRSKLKLNQRFSEYLEQESSSFEQGALFNNQQNDNQEIAKLSALLSEAGFYQKQAVRYLIASKLGLAALVATITWLAMSSNDPNNSSWFVIASLAFVANLLPDHYLKQVALNRQKEILKALPDSLDLISICLESGATFERSLAMVSEHLDDVYPVLTQEWQQTLEQLKVNPDREVAFDDLAKRCPSAEMTSLIAAVKQAEKFGSPLAQTFKNFATEMRQLNKLTLEEKVGKLSAKITLPMLLLVFLPLLIIILAPIGFQLLVALKELN
ncbi:type II secretion system F family protein [Thalassotalea euphylliae]|uniref:Type II secretion system F family protein n=1 Tax=Thalassotalea euphylliae TaxID=1655234 RepID=A0A3E0TN35_9GAMM|nr:type II secretion system F family protein [Thalassotalea euphylliae]REL25954.1 type II secretion system F family protein [Thalassotalea euphylliae]